MTRLVRVVLAAIAVLLLTAGVASAQAVTYQATETIPVPPASDYAGSGGGDGWAVALSSSEVFNVFHHSSTLNVACHYQSDASPCWGPDEITDPDGGSFSTSGQPGLWFDQSNGDLYVYATRNSDSTAGVVCIDTADATVESDPFCGFTALTDSGQAPQNGGISQISDPVLVAGKWYAFNFDDGVTPGNGANQLLCFDTATLQACSGQPYSVPVGSGEDDDTSYPPPAVSAIGDHIIVPITIAGSAELGCFDGATGSACAGNWPVPASSQYAPSSDGAAYPYLSASGTISGLCLPTGIDPCYDLSGNSIATPTNMTTTIGATSGWNGPGLTVGPRVYVPDGNLNQVDCYDYNTQDSCANFPDQLSNLSLLYTVNPDPQRPTCIWVNSDNGSQQIQNFDAYTGGACGEGPVRVLASSLVAPSAQCVPYSYSKIQVLSPSPSSYSGGSVQFEDGDGNAIPGAATAALDQTGSASLAGLSLNTVTGLPQFLITLQTGSQAPQEVQVQLTWTGLADQACEGGGLTVTQPTNPTLTGVTVASGGGSGTAGAPEPRKKKSSSLLSKAYKAVQVGTFGAAVGAGYAGCGALIGVSLETLGLSDIAAAGECGFDADATASLGIAIADPPDAHYRKVFVPVRLKVNTTLSKCARLTVRACRQVQALVLRQERAIARLASVSEAVAVTVDRYGSAARAGDATAASMQRRAEAGFLRLQKAALTQLKHADRVLGAWMQAHGLNRKITVRQIRRARARTVALYGVPKATIRHLERIGLVSSRRQLSKIIAASYKTAGPAHATTLVKLLDDQAH